MKGQIQQVQLLGYLIASEIVTSARLGLTYLIRTRNDLKLCVRHFTAGNNRTRPMRIERA
jgi:hypothetical protein